MEYRVIVAFDGAFDLQIEAQSKEEAEAKVGKLISEDYEGKYNEKFVRSASVNEIYVDTSLLHKFGVRSTRFTRGRAFTRKIRVRNKGGNR